MNFKQRKILKILNEGIGIKYSELYRFFSEEDKFPYHLKYLIKNGFILKNEERYFLTSKGAAYAVNWIDSEYNDLVHKVPRIVLVCRDKDGRVLVKEYVHNIVSIKKTYGLPGIKVRFGTINLDNVIDEVLFNRFGIIGKHSYRCVQNNVFIDDHNEVILDFLYLVFDVEVEKLNENVKGFQWCTIEQVKTLPKISEVLDDFVVNDLRTPFSERKFSVK